MKLKFKPLNEKLYKMSEPGMYAFDYVGGVINLLKKGDKEYRILYDAMLDMYFVCPSYDYTHSGALITAFKDGWYEEHKDEVEEITGSPYDREESWWDYFNESEEGEQLFCLVFSPDRSYELGDDDYHRVYHLKYGDLFTRFYLEDIPDLYNAVKKDIDSEEEDEDW